MKLRVFRVMRPDKRGRVIGCTVRANTLSSAMARLSTLNGGPFRVAWIVERNPRTGHETDITPRPTYLIPSRRSSEAKAEGGISNVQRPTTTGTELGEAPAPDEGADV